MTSDQLSRAKAAGKRPFIATRSGRNARYFLALDLKNAKAKFSYRWTVEPIEWDEFEFWRLEGNL